MTGWLLLVACSGSTGGDDGKTGGDGDSGGGDPSVEVAITSPRDGATFDFAEAIDLTVESTRDGDPIDPKRVSWIIGDWTGSDAETTAEGVPSGDHKVQVEVTIDGDTYTDSVEITVKDAPPLPYNGQINIDLHLDHPDYGEFDDACDGNLTFILDGNDMAGDGTCTEELFDEQFPFSVSGTVRNGTLTGDLILEVDGTSYTTPFEGDAAYGDPITAAFDYTHRADGASLRVYGTWDARP